MKRISSKCDKHSHAIRKGEAVFVDLGWGNEKASKWATNVGLITSDGPHGPNIMAVEWTYYVSYSPALISVHIGGTTKNASGKATLDNIRATKEFGMSLAASGQNVFSSIAGGSSGKDVDKIGLLRELGAKFTAGKHTKVLLLEGAASTAECRVKEITDLGDHVMILGEVLEMDSHGEKQPLIYSFGKYYGLGEMIGKPEQGVLDKIAQLKEKYARKK